MSIQTQTEPSTTSAIPTAHNPMNGSSVSPNKRRRRRRNKNKNKTQQDSKPKSASNQMTNPSNRQTLLYSNKQSKKSKPWQNVKKSSDFDHIMNEQQVQQQPNYGYTQRELDEQQLLEQQMILQAIEESNKLQQQLKQKQLENDDEKKQEMIASNIINTNHMTTKQTEDEAKQIEEKPINDELIAASIDAQSAAAFNGKTQQTMSDELLAIHLQQQEQKELARRQKISQRFEGKHSKVTSSSAHPTAIPKAALKFYYNDESMLNGGLTTEQYQEKLLQQQSVSEEQIVDEPQGQTKGGSVEQDQEEELVAISKHDAKIWSETHMNRLNEYETGGNLDTNMNIGNQAYNSFRNQLDKKGFINYYNYQLEPKDSKR